MVRVLNLSLIYLLSFFSAYAYNVDSNKNNTNYDLSSPRATIITHLGALGEEDCNYQVAARPFLREDRSLEEAIKLAISLKHILDQKEIQIDVDNIPVDPNYIDHKAKFHKYQLTASLPEVYLVKVHNEWVYSEATVNYVNKFYKRQYSFFGKSSPKLILKYLYHKIFFEIEGWQILTLILCLFFSIVIYKLLIFLLQEYYRSLAKTEGYKEIISLVRPTSLFVITLLFKVMLPFMNLPKLFEDRLLIYVNVFLFFIVSVLVYYLVDLFAFYIRKQTLDKKLKFNLVLLPMVKVMLKVLVVIIGSIVTLQSFGLNVRGLIAGVGIGGLGFALASQDTIKNFFGSLVILIDKPFNIGDYITSENVSGKIEEIGFRSTRIRTNKDSKIYVPNGKLADTYIDNHGLKQYKQFITNIPISYTTPIPLIETFIEGLRKIGERCPSTREGKYYIYLYNLQESILYIKFELKFDVTDRNSELSSRHDILLKIIKLAKKLDIDFAFPTHTVHMEDFSKKKALLVNFDDELAGLKERLQAFLNEEATV